MKAAALYHLLQIRARKFEERAEPDAAGFLREIQASLKVEYANSEYLLSWSHAGRSHTLQVSGDTFSFYLAGDNLVVTAARKGVTGYRAMNWSGAAAVWRAVASTSGVNTPLVASDDSLGLMPLPTDAWSVSWRRLVVLGGPAAVLAVALAVKGWPIGLSAVALLATILAALLCAMPPRRALTMIEAGVISVGAMAPLIYGFAPPLLVGPVAGMVVVSIAERMTGWSSFVLWSLGGIVLGVSAATHTSAAASVVVLGIALCVTALLAPAKLSRQGIACLGLGLAVGLALAALASSLGAPAPASSNAVAGSYELAADVIGGALVVGFFVWCTHGVLFRVVPWFCVLSLGVFALTAVARREWTVVVSATALSGFTIFLAVRILEAWTVSSSPASGIQGSIAH